MLIINTQSINKQFFHFFPFGGDLPPPPPVDYPLPADKRPLPVPPQPADPPPPHLLLVTLRQLYHIMKTRKNSIGITKKAK